MRKELQAKKQKILAEAQIQADILQEEIDAISKSVSFTNGLLGHEPAFVWRESRIPFKKPSPTKRDSNVGLPILVEQCVETLCKYLENILHNPGEEKYHRIRQSNRVFQERVAPLEGTQDLLQAAGFQAEDDYLVFSEERLQTPDTLQILCDALRSAEPITLELDHNLQVLLPSQAASRRELPPVFYNLTPEEIKREQQNSWRLP
uniref:PUB domain-containing protein n=1 Tax=Timema cristinae TaxID=61476 RepID=A0A7R9DFD3_TIMCR|nr:unnamed protein product [Timema cristinae]